MKLLSVGGCALLVACSGGSGGVCEPTEVARMAPRPVGGGPRVASLPQPGKRALVWRYARVPDIHGSIAQVEAWIVDEGGAAEPTNLMPPGCTPLCYLERVSTSDIGAGFLWAWSPGTDLDYRLQAVVWDGTNPASTTTLVPSRAEAFQLARLAWSGRTLFVTWAEPTTDGRRFQLFISTIAVTGEMGPIQVIGEVPAESTSTARIVGGGDAAVVVGTNAGLRQYHVTPTTTTDQGPRGLPGDELLDLAGSVASPLVLVCRGGTPYLLDESSDQRLDGLCSAKLATSGAGAWLFFHDSDPDAEYRVTWHTRRIAPPAADASACGIDANDVTLLEIAGQPELWSVGEEEGEVVVRSRVLD